ncbi:Methylthioribulose-1-phosphate dehydratase [Frankliniella fusca]|uniref:Methylthioribulose-1-phosphate dehydratase n=1 Tax=Frankliniella fusca TaxID=407009 RepID=A0AAE1HT17_9NEOP|nr:Methylthioribulose-1-phosphate dehydratase [Frankliniella fusca]
MVTINLLAATRIGELCSKLQRRLNSKNSSETRRHAAVYPDDANIGKDVAVPNQGDGAGTWRAFKLNQLFLAHGLRFEHKPCTGTKVFVL